MKAIHGTKVPTGWSDRGDDMCLRLSQAPVHGQAGMRLIDYLQLVIASLQSDHGFSETEATELTFNLSTVLCISDAHWQGYTSEATACSVVQLHSHRRLS